MSEVISYKYPPIAPDVSGNAEQWVQSLPINGSVFRSDQTSSIVFNIASTSQFMKTVKSFVTGKLVPKDVNNATIPPATPSTSQGVSRAFSRVVIRMGGAIVEDIPNYNDLVSLLYSTESLGKKSILGRLEGYNKTDFFNGGATPWAHMLVASLFVTPQSIPLPLLTGGGGLSIELYLAPHTELFYGASNVAYYQMEGVSMKYLALTPDPAFTLGLKSAVAAGDSAYIPLQCIKAFPSNGNGSNNQIINVAIGQKSSIVSIQTVFWDSTGTGDKAIRFTNAGLTSWDIKAADIQNPANIQFQYGVNGSVPESLLTMLMTEVGSGYRIGDEVSLPANYDTQNFSVSFNFQSSGEHFASGLSTVGSASPFLTIETNHSVVVPASTNITTWVTYDCLLELKGNNIVVRDIL